MNTSDGNSGLDWRVLWHDLVFSARSVFRARTYSLTTVLTLAVGMYFTVNVWHFTSWAVTSAEPYPHPEEVYCAGFTTPESPNFNGFQTAIQLKAYRDQLNVRSALSRGKCRTWSSTMKPSRRTSRG